MVNTAREPSGRITASSLWLHSTADRPVLRIGLLLDSWTLPRFAAAIVDDIQNSNFAKLELLVLKRGPGDVTTLPSRRMASKLIRRLSNSDLRKHALHTLYLKYDAKRRGDDHPLTLVDCTTKLAGIDQIEVEPIGKKFVHRFSPEAIEQIRQKKLDVMIRFGFGILKGEILSAARYGIWSYHHGDNEFYRGGPPHFWELWEGAPLSGVVLQVLTEELDAGLVLCKSNFPTHKTLSVSENRAAPYWGTADLVIRKLHELHEQGWEHVRAHALPPVPYKGKRKLYRAPTNADMVRWLAPVFLKKAVRYAGRPNKVLQWKLGIRLNHTPILESSGEALEGFHWIEPPRGHFWADPFVLEESGKRWVVFEDYSYREGRAGIACAEISHDGRLLAPTACLTHPKHHYSYPYLLRDGDDLYMMPESYESDTVDLFRCRRFPDEWVHHHTLLRGGFVDTSLWFHEGLWWMLTTIADPHPRSTQLLLFYSDSLTGNWQFHPANPISTDIRNNRGAGRIFSAGNRWIRPSQCGAPVYGYSFAFNEITELTTTSYSERLLKTVTPETFPGFCGVHTYNAIPQCELIDGAMMAPTREVLLRE